MVIEIPHHHRERKSIAPTTCQVIAFPLINRESKRAEVGRIMETNTKTVEIEFMDGTQMIVSTSNWFADFYARYDRKKYVEMRSQ